MIRIVRACCNWNSRRAFRIAFYSGMRLGEILKYSVRSGNFVLADTKNGDPRLVPIHPKIGSAVARFDQGTAKMTIQRAFTRTVRKIGMGHLHLHDLRHSAASELINAGGDLYTVGHILGQKDSRSIGKLVKIFPTCQKEKPAFAGFSICGNPHGYWRRGWDSNPRYDLTYA